MKNKIKKIAIEMVERDGLINLSRSELCEAAGISDGSFRHVVGCSFSEFVVELQQMNLKNPYTKVVKSRTHPALRREHILNTAVALAEEIGYDNITQSVVAEKAGVSCGLISLYFSMPQLKTEVMSQAVDFEVLGVVAQGIVNRHPRIKFISEILKRKAVNYLNRVNK